MKTAVMMVMVMMCNDDVNGASDEYL